MNSNQIKKTEGCKWLEGEGYITRKCGQRDIQWYVIPGVGLKKFHACTREGNSLMVEESLMMHGGGGWQTEGRNLSLVPIYCFVKIFKKVRYKEQSYLSYDKKFKWGAIGAVGGNP